MEQEAETPADDKTKEALAERVRGLANRHLEDEEILSSANALLKRLNAAPVSWKKPNLGGEKPKSDQSRNIVSSRAPDAGQNTMSVYSPATMDAKPVAKKAPSRTAKPVARDFCKIHDETCARQARASDDSNAAESFR